MKAGRSALDRTGTLSAMKGIRFVPDRRPRFSLWIQGKPRSQQAKGPKGPSSRYARAIQATAKEQVNGPPLSSSTVDVEIIYATRGTRVEADNVAKPILDALAGIVYDDDKQVRSVKIVGLRLDQSFHARGVDRVFHRLLIGQEFLVNIYDGGEVDVHLVDSRTTHNEKTGVLMLAVARPVPTG